MASLAMVASVLTVALAFPADAADNRDGYLTLNGGDYLVADTFANGVGDLDVIFYAAADDWSANGLQAIVAHWPGATANQAMRVQFTSAGHLQLVVKDSAGKGHSFSAWATDMSLVNGRGYWFRTRFDASSPAGSTTKFYVSSDPITKTPTDVTWGNTVRTSTDNQAITLRNNTGRWTIGAAEGGSGSRFKGDLGYVGVWRNGWSTTNGTRIVNMNFRIADQASNGYATWTESSHTWTVKGNGWTYSEPTGNNPPPSNGNYMNLNGSAGTYLTTPSTSNGSSNMEFQFYVAPDDYTNGTQTILARWPGAEDKSKIRVQFAPSGLLQVLIKDVSGGASWVFNGLKASALGLANGEGQWFRVRVDVNDGSGSRAVFWSSDAPASANPASIGWGSADNVSKKTSVLNPRNNTGKWEIGSYNSGADGRLKGDVHYVALWRSGYATSGTKVLDLDLRDSAKAADANEAWSVWLDSVGNTWTARGNGWTYVTDDTPPPPPPPPTNTKPTAKTDHFTVTEGQTLVITRSSLLANDTDPENDALSVKSVSSPSSMGRAVTANGTKWNYTAGSNAGGAVDTITYTIEDTAGNTDNGQIKVTIENDGGGDPTGYDVIINPGDNIASIVAGKPNGTSFYIKAGKYRLQQIQPKHGMTFVGQNGAVLSGAKKLTSFGQSGGLWYADGQTQGTGGISQGSEYGWCGTSGNNACVFPEQLIINNVQQEQVDTKGEVGAGEFYFDYSANRIWFKTSPTGKTVETSVTRYAFWGNADNVTIQNLVIEKYANPGPHGAINPRMGRIGSPADDWTIKNNTIRYNNGYAILLEDGLDIIGNNIHHNGHMGIAGNGSNILIKNNEIAYSCLHDYNCWPGLGALKLVDVHNTTVKGNYVHHNYTHALHSDELCTNLVFEDNIVTDNEGAGLSQEISAGAVIRNNVFERNGFKPDGGRVAGIIILNSRDVEVVGNTLRDNADGIILRQDQRTNRMKLTDVWVHNNTVHMNGVARTGITLTGGVTDTSYYTSRNNRFDYNTYTFDYSSQWHKPFFWIGGQASEQTWKAAGMGAHSNYSYI
ncbi:MAG: hypothetical protein GY720_16960 [bacterium]|nr:hypothetical protein [bacterium]